MKNIKLGEVDSMNKLQGLVSDFDLETHYTLKPVGNLKSEINKIIENQMLNITFLTGNILNTDIINIKTVFIPNIGYINIEE